MQSFKRGMPLLPAFDDEQPDTEIDAGEPYGLKRWVRYETATRINSVSDVGNCWGLHGPTCKLVISSGEITGLGDQS
jgi:hypothetical protein